MSQAGDGSVGVADVGQCSGAYPSLEPGYTLDLAGCLIKMSFIP